MEPGHYVQSRNVLREDWVNHHPVKSHQQCLDTIEWQQERLGDLFEFRIVRLELVEPVEC